MQTNGVGGEDAQRQVRVRSLICDNTAFVAKILHGAGVASSDVADEVQRTFISAARRIDDIKPGSERGFLLSVATKIAAHTRRTYARRREVLSGELPELADGRLSPEYIAEQKQISLTFERLLDSIDEPLRSVFTLQAIERLGARETAAILGIPTGTVASKSAPGRMVNI